jgi:hypothetical protein
MGAVLVAVLTGTLLAGCSDGDEGGQFTLAQPPPGEEACAYTAEPTPELDAVRARLERAGYRAHYGGYSVLGYFIDEAETEEFCADSALSVEGNGIDDLDRFTIRQYDDPERFEQGVDDLRGNRLSFSEREPLFYFYAGSKQSVVDRVVAAAEG